MSIGIIGYGVVGKAIEFGFPGCDVLISDPNPKYADRAVGVDDLAEQCEFIFVAVPTPMTDVTGGKADTRIIDGVIGTLSCYEEPIVIIKSAVEVATAIKYRDKYPDMHLVVSPEYLTDASSMRDFLFEELLILGGDIADTKRVEQLFAERSMCRYPRPVGHCDIVGAALIKYMENSFLALKVTFMNQFYDLAKALGVKTSWHELMRYFHYDSRMGNSHFDVPGPDGDRGWGGKCLPKDVNAIIHTAQELGVDLSLMEKAWEANLKIRKNIDWANIEGAVSQE